jgi:putative DNA primase/helicase
MTAPRENFTAAVKELLARAEELAQAPQQPAGEALDGTLEKLPHLTDQGNAAWLAHLHGQDLRYCWATSTFYWWDGTRWVADTHGKVDWWTRDVAHKLYELAAGFNTAAAGLNNRAAAEPDPDGSKRLADAAAKMSNLAQAYTKWGRNSESSERMSAMLRCVKSEPGITVQARDFDRHPWLINCLNGTLDLGTGQLREHRREDLITHVLPFGYDPDARLPLWDWFLERAQRNPQVIGFLARAVGYSATGLTTEEKLFFCYGDGSTGKSTFLQAIAATLGPYAATADFEAFLQKDRSAGHSADIARLAGKRMVIGIEVDEGKKLAEALVKQLTGGDIITASHKYQDAFEFRPTFSLWLAANHRPRVRADDKAMWRRISMTPFDQVIPEEERDPQVKAQLTDPQIAGPAILAWIVQGCLEWQVMGLCPPQEVIEATEEYRREMSPVTEFIDTWMVVQEGAQADNTDTYQQYLKWAADNGIRYPLKQKAFTQAMKALGHQQDRKNHSRYWVGLGLVADEEPPGDR